MTNVSPLRNPETVDPTGNRFIPNVAIETRMIVDLVRTKPEGTTITYDELATRVGREVRPGNRGYGYLNSAKRILIRDYGIVLDSEKLVGVRVCTDKEKVAVSGRIIGSARRAVKRSLRTLDATDMGKLDAPARTELLARRSIIGGLVLMTAPKAIKLVEQKVTDQALPSAHTLEIFKG